MQGHQIIKHLELAADSPSDMARRLHTFQQALRVRSGAVVSVRWLAVSPTRHCEVRVTYQVPREAQMSRAR